MNSTEINNLIKKGILPTKEIVIIKPKNKDLKSNLKIVKEFDYTPKKVEPKDFTEHYRIMSADSDFRFSEEYEELKHVGREKPCAAADMPVNRPKNRFWFRNAKNERVIKVKMGN